jgi:hypothetical protein
MGPAEPSAPPVTPPDADRRSLNPFLSDRKEEPERMEDVREDGVETNPFRQMSGGAKSEAVSGE